MKKYSFRLETVLRVRRIQEEQARFALLAANRAALEAAAEVTRRREHLDEQTTRTVPSEYHAFIGAHEQGARLAGAVRTAAQVELEALEVQVEKREHWGERAQRVASLERLDERSRDAYAIEFNRDEMKLVDDLVTSRFGRNADHA